MAISINNTGAIIIPAGISGYSTTAQVNTLINNNLANYTTSANLSSNYASNTTLTNYSTTSQTSTLISNSLTNYVSNSSLTSTLSNYSTTTQTNTLVNSSIVTNQNIMSIIFLTFVDASDFSSNVYNYNSLFQALIVDVGAASSGLGTFIQANSNSFTNGQSFY